MIIPKIQKFIGKGLGWIIDSVVDLNNNVSKYKPLDGSSYIKLPKELSHPKKEKFKLIFKISMIMNSLNGVWSDIYILQIIIQYELERFTEILPDN